MGLFEKLKKKKDDEKGLDIAKVLEKISYAERELEIQKNVFDDASKLYIKNAIDLSERDLDEVINELATCWVKFDNISSYLWRIKMCIDAYASQPVKKKLPLREDFFGYLESLPTIVNSCKVVSEMLTDPPKIGNDVSRIVDVLKLAHRVIGDFEKKIKPFVPDFIGDPVLESDKEAYFNKCVQEKKMELLAACSSNESSATIDESVTDIIFKMLENEKKED